jgi:hypothetical protein
MRIHNTDFVQCRIQLAVDFLGKMCTFFHVFYYLLFISRLATYIFELATRLSTEPHIYSKPFPKTLPLISQLATSLDLTIPVSHPANHLSTLSSTSPILTGFRSILMFFSVFILLSGPKDPALQDRRQGLIT